MYLDVATGGELHVALAAGVPADRLVLHGNNKSDDELAPRARGGRRPHRRRQLRRARPPRRACHAGTARAPTVLLRVTPGRRGPHPRVRADRPGRLEVRLRPRRRATPTRAIERAAASPSRRAGRHPRPHRQPDLRGRLLRAGGRGRSRRSSRALGLPELSIGGGLGVAYVEGEDGAVDHRVGAGACRRPVREAGIARAHHGRAGSGDRRRRPRSRSTRSAR